MTKLNCTARNCVNNEGGLCGAEYILVQGEEANISSETFCSNFKEETVMSQVGALGNTNYVGEIMQMLSSDYDVKMNPVVACHARRCFYNANGRCGARDISIMGYGGDDARDTKCETFIK